MRVGILGIGDIALKAYIPVLTSMESVEVFLCSRNVETLKNASSRYKIAGYTTHLNSFLDWNLDCIYLTSHASSHYDLAKRILEKRVPVIIDKPISFHLSQTHELYELSKSLGVHLMVNFNRRFIDFVDSMKTKGQPRHLVYQKNRIYHADEPRRMIVEDFIHCIDTARFLMDDTVKSLLVNATKTSDGLVSCLQVILKTKTTSSILILDYLHGGNTESIEVNFSKETYVSENFDKHFSLIDDARIEKKESDWTETLYKRGFRTMINQTLQAIKTNSKLPIPIEDSLETHRLAELIVEMVLNDINFKEL